MAAGAYFLRLGDLRPPLEAHKIGEARPHTGVHIQASYYTNRPRSDNIMYNTMALQAQRSRGRSRVL